MLARSPDLTATGKDTELSGVESQLSHSLSSPSSCSSTLTHSGTWTHEWMHCDVKSSQSSGLACTHRATNT